MLVTEDWDWPSSCQPARSQLSRGSASLPRTRHTPRSSGEAVRYSKNRMATFWSRGMVSGPMRRDPNIGASSWRPAAPLSLSGSHCWKGLSTSGLAATTSLLQARRASLYPEDDGPERVFQYLL